MVESKVLRFHITGSYLTNMAREMYWENRSSREKAVGFLMKSISSPELSDKEMRLLSLEILLGVKKIVGSTEDNSIDIVEDYEFDVMKYIEEDRNLIKSLNVKLNSLGEEISEEAEEIGATSYSKSMVIDYLAAQKFDDNYGYIKPDGEFIAVEWGEHIIWARKEVDSIEGSGQYLEWCESMNRSQYAMIHQDFLIEQRRYCLLHSPSQGVAHPKHSLVYGLTKGQREFLFDYYTKRGLHELAESMLE